MSGWNHTPGPWKAVEVGQGGPADNPMPVIEIRSADDHAVVAEYVDAWNATLLAACPDLLAACKAMSAHYSGSLDHQPAYVRLARDALAKAEGRA